MTSVIELKKCLLTFDKTRKISLLYRKWYIIFDLCHKEIKITSNDSTFTCNYCNFYNFYTRNACALKLY